MDMFQDTTSDISPEMQALVEQEAVKVAEEYVRQLDTLAQSIEGEFRRRKSLRSPKEQEWLNAEALYLGPLALDTSRYESTPFVKSLRKRRPNFNIVGQKCDLAIAAVVSGQFGGGDKNWGLTESAAPDYSIVEDVTTPAMLMEREIQDQLDECDYGRRSREAITDYVVKGTGIMKSPLTMGGVKKTWRQSQDSDGNVVWIPEYSNEFQPGVVRCDPWLEFPDPSATRIEDCDDWISLHPMTSRQLKELTYNSGFDAETISAIMAKGMKDLSSDSEPDNKWLSTNTEAWKNRYLVLEAYWKVPKEILQMGAAKTYDEDTVFCEVWVCQGKVIRIQEPMLETCRRPPYHAVAWKKDPGSIFGLGAAVTMQDQQRVVTEAWHMVLDNAEVSSGPQVAINNAMVEAADGENAELRGWKLWNITEYGANVQEAIQFFNPPNNQEPLMAVLNAAREFADVESGIPMIVGGGEGPGMESGATGAAIRKQSSTSLLFQKITDWDDYITRPIIQNMYEWNMIYNKKSEIKGDFEIDVDSSSSALKRELETAALEKLSIEASQNPEMGIVIDMAELQKTRLQMMKLSNKKIVKSPEAIAQAREQQAQQPNPQMLELEIKQQELKLREREIALKEAELEFNQRQGQQREQWDHEERLANTEARNYENMVDLRRAEVDWDVQRMQLGMKRDEAVAAIQADLLIKDRKLKLDEFKAGADIQIKAKDQALTEAEQEIKRRQGSGI